MIALMPPAATTSTGQAIWTLYCYPATGTYATSLTGRCPNCGEVHYYVDTDTNITISHELPPKVRARQLKWEASKRAVTRARLALQQALDDPRPEIPLPERKRPYVRPRAKKRVCAGSSRYRVMVN